MKFAKVYSAQPEVLSARIIDVEVDVAQGLHSFSIIGLPDKAIEESRDRVCAAIKHSGFTSPKTKHAKVTISLAPAHVKKTGHVFDVAIAVGYLLAVQDISFDPEGKLFLGEVSLDGVVRPIRGVLPMVRRASLAGFTDVFVPAENAKEARLVRGIRVFSVHTLRDLTEHLDEKTDICLPVVRQPKQITRHETHSITLDDIHGHEHAKRALMIAAAGNHNMMLFGPPGTGKTMLAKSIQSCLPQLSSDDMLDTTSIHSVAGLLSGDCVVVPPFRSPHHTSSYVSIIGGGNYTQPGEITLAHNGVLFLDEFPEFDRRVIDALRQPLEEREITVARANARATFPANILLITAMNPCPCGMYGSESNECTCPQHRIEQYQKKISGPILDRIGLWVHVPTIDMKTIEQTKTRRAHNRQSSTIQQPKETPETDYAKTAIASAYAIQKNRNPRGVKNALLTSTQVDTLCALLPEAQHLLHTASERLRMSIRSYYNTIKVAQTIADLTASPHITSDHILEALQYRQNSI